MPRRNREANDGPQYEPGKPGRKAWSVSKPLRRIVLRFLADGEERRLGEIAYQLDRSRERTWVCLLAMEARDEVVRTWRGKRGHGANNESRWQLTPAMIDKLRDPAELYDALTLAETVVQHRRAAVARGEGTRGCSCVICTPVNKHIRETSEAIIDSTY